MSRYYNMRVKIQKFDKSRHRKINEACAEEWPFDGLDSYEIDDGTVLMGDAEGNLGGGETEEDFADRIAGAVWKANQGYCQVNVIATYLEDLPYEIHERRYQDYRKWKKKAA